jgi:hypothetical protein
MRSQTYKIIRRAFRDAMTLADVEQSKQDLIIEYAVLVIQARIEKGEVEGEEEVE